MKTLGIVDSDSYLKWGAAALARMEGDRTLVIVETPTLPSAAQRAAAVEGLDGVQAEPPVVSLAELRALARELQPDVVLLSLRGPLIRVVLREVLAVSARRPVFVSGLPGISYPATRKALTFRSQVDLILLHSRREIREFTELAERMGLRQQFGLARLPFLEHPETETDTDVPVRDEIVFAVQAKVPRLRSERQRILSWLAETARTHPNHRVVIKLRAVAGEAQTHREYHPYDELLAELEARPVNLVAESGSMSSHLERAAGLVTVSSTALIEAVSLGIPGIALCDFGVSKGLINPVFEGSGLLQSSEELIAGHFRVPEPDWLDDNNFHPAEANDWLQLVGELAAERELHEIPLRRLAMGRAGGRLRYVWDRKRALGSLDTSPSGYIALAIGYPARSVYLSVRRLVRLAKRRMSPQRVTPAIASTTMAPPILDDPASRSRNTIGTSTIGSPESNTRMVISIWNE
jgi:hypothetical protein